MARAVRVVAVLCALGVVWAPTAAADPAKPTNYRSTVDSITPATSALHATVVGGDGFLQVEVARGHELHAAGYQGEPWLEIDADGTVRENQAAPTHFLNENRYGTVIPEGVTPEGAAEHPSWKVVGRSGRFVWHDHRIHYMTPQLPPRLIPGTRRVAIGSGPDGRWEVPVVLDGVPTTITGTLELFDAPPPAVGWVIVTAVALAVAGFAFVVRAKAIVAGIAAMLAAGGLAVWAGVAELAVVPSEAGGNPLAVGLPGFGVACALLAVLLRTAASRVIALFAGAAALGAWALLRVGALDKAFPLGDLAPATARAIIAVGLGAAVGTIAAGVASGGLALRLDELDVVDDAPALDSGSAAGAADEGATGADDAGDAASTDS